MLCVPCASNHPELAHNYPTHLVPLVYSSCKIKSDGTFGYCLLKTLPCTISFTSTSWDMCVLLYLFIMIVNRFVCTYFRLFALPFYLIVGACCFSVVPAFTLLFLSVLSPPPDGVGWCSEGGRGDRETEVLCAGPLHRRLGPHGPAYCPRHAHA